MTLFALASADPEPFVAVLDAFYGGAPDPATLAVDDCDASSEDGFLLTWDAAAGRVTWLGCMPRDGVPEAPFDAVFAELVAL